MFLSTARTISLSLCVLAGIGVLSWLSFYRSPEAKTPSQPAASLTVTYIGNEGVLLGAGQQQVLIDGLHREYKPDYQFPPPELLAALESARAPYNGIDLVLVSHLHLDHFHPDSVGLHLQNNKSAQLISSEQIVSGVKGKLGNLAEIEPRIKQINYEWKSSTKVEVEGIKVRVLGLRHSGANFTWVQNLGHVIEMGGKKLLHIGDADMTAENFATFRLHEEKIDIAFIPYWFLLSENGRTLVREQFGAKQIIAVHVPPAEAEEVTRRLATMSPGTIVFTKVLESRSF